MYEKTNVRGAGLTKVKAVELKSKIENNVLILNLSTLSMHGHRS